MDAVSLLIFLQPDQKDIVKAYADKQQALREAHRLNREGPAPGVWTVETLRIIEMDALDYNINRR